MSTSSDYSHALIRRPRRLRANPAMRELVAETALRPADLILPMFFADGISELLPPVMPARFARVGTVVFGTKRKQTVAWLLETSEELEEVARNISALNPNGRGQRWVPHLTMGLRLPREIVPDYIRALDEVTSPHFKEFTATTAAYWRPKIHHLTVFKA